MELTLNRYTKALKNIGDMIHLHVICATNIFSPVYFMSFGLLITFIFLVIFRQLYL